MARVRLFLAVGALLLGNVCAADEQLYPRGNQTESANKNAQPPKAECDYCPPDPYCEENCAWKTKTTTTTEYCTVTTTEYCTVTETVSNSLRQEEKLIAIDRLRSPTTILQSLQAPNISIRLTMCPRQSARRRQRRQQTTCPQLTTLRRCSPQAIP